MRLRLTLDFRHWMLGVSFNHYTMLLSIGPINIWVLSEKRYKRYLEDCILQNVRRIGNQEIGGNQDV
jgi:hypothetical protein